MQHGAAELEHRPHLHLLAAGHALAGGLCQLLFVCGPVGQAVIGTDVLACFIQGLAHGLGQCGAAMAVDDLFQQAVIEQPVYRGQAGVQVFQLHGAFSESGKSV